MSEIWKPVVGYEGLYEVSNFGHVDSLGWKNSASRRRLSPIKRMHYLRVHLTDARGMQKHCSIHRLVAAAFIKNPLNKPKVNHLDSNSRNNRAENLEWCTQHENVLHAHLKGRVGDIRGEKNVQSKLTVHLVQIVRHLRKDFNLKHRELVDVLAFQGTSIKIKTIRNVLYGRCWSHVIGG